MDRELERINRETPPVFDNAEETVVKKVTEIPDLLSEHVDNYKPATTIVELDAQMFQAQSLGAKAVEATPEIIRHFCGKDYSENYFMYKGVRVYKAGTVETVKALESMTMEQKVFGTKVG